MLMKAITFEKYGQPEVLVLKEIEKPIPRSNEIIIKIYATTATAGDCELRRPDIPNFAWLIARLFFGLFKPKIKVLGSYIAGRIDSVGSDIRSFKEGELVFGVTGPKFGGYAEYVCLRDSSALSYLPNNTSYEEAAPIALGLDSLHFLRKGKIKAGERVLINGAGGGIGTYAVQLAKYFGTEVTAVDSSPKLDMLKRIGATKTIDYTKENLIDSNVKYDMIFDVVGKISYRDSLKLLKDNGRYISAIPTLPILLKGLWTRIVTKKKVITGLANPNKTDLDFMKSLIEKKYIETVIDSKFSLDNTIDAHRYIEKDTKSGNVIIVINH